MISRYNYNGITWVDLISPTKEEALTIAEEFGIGMFVVEELIRPTVRSRVDVYPEYLYLILHFPIVSHELCGPDEDHCNVDQIELNFVIGKRFLITARYDKINPLAQFQKLFETNALAKNKMTEHGGFLFFEMAKELYAHSLKELDHIETTLHDIEKKIFEGHEDSNVEQISDTSRKLLDFKKAIRFHGEVLKSFEIAGNEFFGHEFKYYLASIGGEYNQVASVLESQRDMLHDLRETNDSLLSKKINVTMRTLTVLSFMVVPFTIFTSLFGMNAVHMPIIGNAYDFWIIVGFIITAMLIIILFFKKNKWL